MRGGGGREKESRQSAHTGASASSEDKQEFVSQDVNKPEQICDEKCNRPEANLIRQELHIKKNPDLDNTHKRGQ